MDKKKVSTILWDIVYLAIGGFIYSIAYNMFLVPGEIFVGGVGGISTVLHVLYGWPTGLMIFLLNLPLVILFAIFYGLRSSIKTIICISVGSVFVDVFAALDIFPSAFANPTENKLLYAIFGGIVLGSAIGIMFSRGYTSGGTDIVALLLKLKFKKLSMSNLILLIDVVVILYAAISMKDWLTILYSFVVVFMFTNTISIVTGGFDKGGLAYIFSSKYEEIADAISTKMHRGVTLVDGMGWYNKTPCKVILCVVKKSEMFQLKLLAKQMDPDSFMIMSETTETLGRGFKMNVGDAGFEKKPIEKAKKE